MLWSSVLLFLRLSSLFLLVIGVFYAVLKALLCTYPIILVFLGNVSRLVTSCCSHYVFLFPCIKLFYIYKNTHKHTRTHTNLSIWAVFLLTDHGGMPAFFTGPRVCFSFLYYYQFQLFHFLHYCCFASVLTKLHPVSSPANSVRLFSVLLPKGLMKIWNDVYYGKLNIIS